MRSIASALCFLTAVSLQAQVLLTGPNTLTFSTTTGGAAPAGQVIAVRHTGDTPRTITLQLSTNSGGNWLSVSSSTATTPAKITVSVNPTGLPTGSYSGTILIGAQGIASSRVDVTLNVVTSSQLTITPTSLTFVRQSGVTTLPTADQQVIAVNTTGSPANITVTTSVTDTGSWLSATATPGTPGSITASVNTTGLAPGTYSGTIKVESAGLTTVNIPVTLTVSVNPIISLGVNPINIAIQRGSTASTQSIPVQTSNGSSLSFTATSSTTSGGNWLIVTPFIGTAPGNVDVAVNPTGLNPGTYNGTVQIAAAGAANPNLSVPVVLTVTDFPIISATPRTLTLDLATDLTQNNLVRELPAIAVTSVSGATPFTTSVTTFNGGAWLTAGPGSGSTNSNVVSFIDATGLLAGTYRGQITIAGPGNSIVIPVTLTISGSTQISIDPNTITFNLQKNQTAPSNQIVTVGSTGASYAFLTTVTSITPAGSTWLTGAGASGSTPTQLTFGINQPVASGLPAGQYTATVAFTAQPGTSPVLTGSPTLNVVLNVSDTPLFNLSPTSIDFVMPLNGTVTPRTFAITATDGSSRAFTISSTTTSGGNWLTVGPTAGNTPTNISVSALPFGLGVGTYEGTVQVTVPSISNTPQNIRVRLIIQPNVTISATPNALSFTQASGAAAPAARTIAIAASAGVANFQVTSSTQAGGNWLSVSPSGGVTPGNLTVTVNGAGLAAGTYNGSIGVTSGDANNSPLLIPVSLTVGAPSLGITPTSVTLLATPGSTAPVTQQLTVSSGPTGFTATVATTSGGNWLSVTPASSTTSPSTVTVSASPLGLQGGTYQGTITFSGAGVLNSPITVPVTFNVATAAPAGRQILSQIADGAGWKTTIILVNLDTEAAPFSLRFHASDGSALRLPFEGTTGRLEVFDGVIPVGGSRTILTAGTDTVLSQGWAELVSNRNVSGLAVFRQRVTGRPDQEAGVSTTLPSSRFVLPYDNTQGFVSSMAIANTNALSSRATSVTPRNEDGSALLGDFINLPALGYSSFSLVDRFPALANRRGAAEFTSSNPDFAALGLRFNNGGAFTSLPTLDVPLTSPGIETTKVISQIAEGSGWKTTITLVNLDTVAAPFTIRFWRQDGIALQVPLTGGTALDTIEGSIPVGGTRVIESFGGSAALVQGWAQLTSSRNINGLAVFRQRVPGRPDQEAAVTLTPTTSRFVMPFDNTTDFTTTMALVNTTASLGSTVNVVVRDETGAQIGAETIPLVGRGYSAFSLADRIVSTRGRRGTVEFSSSSLITGLGLRFNSGGAFTSFPVLPKN